MDKIARVRQEIERRIDILTNVYAEQVERKDEEMMNYYHGKVIALEELRPFLDTLSEQPDKSLEEAAEELFETIEIQEHENIFEDTFKKIFIAGAEWQKEQVLAEMAQSKSPLSVAYANRCFENGKQAMKEQMLKDAVEGEAVKIFEEGVASIHYNAFAIGEMAYFCKSDNIHLGQKVRIVVLKAEEE